MKTMMWAAAAAVILGACTLGAVEGSALAAPTRITWTDSGNNQSGRFEGTFTASALLCPSGTFHDLGGLLGIEAVHTCSDGTFTFKTQTPDTWAFTAGGTGRYSTLRGRGTCQVTQTEQGIVRTCEALADFDATPPSARIERARVTRSVRAYTLRVAFSAADNVAENAVAFKLSAVASGRRLASRAGEVGAGTTELVLKVRPPARARTLVVALEVVDPLGNARTVRRSLKLRR